MRAILKYGQFTAMIDLPEARPIVSIMKPPDTVSFLPLPEQDLDKPTTARLDFRFREELYEGICLYEFDSEH